MWTYGEEGQAYPVQSGDVWRSGSHLFACTDLFLQGDILRDLLRHSPPTVLYCDPPWGQALLNGFRTKAGLGKATYRWEDLYHEIAMIAHENDIPAWIEGSAPETADGMKIPSVIAHPSSPSVGREWRVRYNHANPSGLYYASPRDAPPAVAVEGMDDEDIPASVLSEYGSGGVVVDPCSGRGLTSREAESVGWTSINNELNPHRVSAALARLYSTNGEPRKVSEQ